MIVTNIICKDSESTIAATIESISKCTDFLNITDTGSQDKTKEIIKETCNKLQFPFKLTDFQWIDDFAAARNFNFQQIPPEADWLVWVDSDDIIEEDKPNYLRDLAKGAPPQIGAFWIPYHYAFDEFGNVTTMFIRERLLRACFGWKWQCRVHETVVSNSPCQMVKDAGVRIKHTSRHGDRAERNFKLLERMLIEEPEHLRTWMYMGHQHFAGGNWKEAIQWYQKFAGHPDVLPIERYQALTYACRASMSLNDFQQASYFALTALEVFPEWGEAYVLLSMAYGRMGQFQKSIFWGEASRGKGIPEEVIFINPLDYTFNVEVCLFEAYASLGQMDKSMKCLDAALQVRPMPELKAAKENVQEAKARESIGYGLKALCMNLLKNGELLKLQKITSIIPSWMFDIPDTSTMLEGIYRQTANILVPKTETKVDQNSIFLGTDFLIEEGVIPAYKETLVCNGVLENVDIPLAEALFRMESFADTVEIEVGKSGLRKINQLEMERALAQPNRNIVDAYTDDGVLHIKFNHSIPPITKLAIRLFLGGAPEPWNPPFIRKNGFGGSEISAAWLSKELTRQGNRVVLYAMDNGVYDSVLYRNQFNPQYPPSDLFISSRVPQVFDSPIVAKVKMLWVHDVHCGQGLTPSIANKLDAIIVLSKWHLRFMQNVYPWLRDCEIVDMRGDPETYVDNVEHPGYFPNEKLLSPPRIFIIADSIEIDKFQDIGVTQPKEFPHRFIWMSAPDRGLEQLLDLWPKILSALPRAELKIFYGWEFFDKTIHIPAQKQLKDRLLEKIKQQGVEWVGRVNPDRLIDELKVAGIWLYPPPHDFRETCCISAIECQAAGVLCFYRMNGALGEAIGDRGVALPLGASQDEILKSILDTLTDPIRCATMRLQGREWAMKHSYQFLSNNFQEAFKLCLEKGKK